MIRIYEVTESQLNKLAEKTLGTAYYWIRDKNGKIILTRVSSHFGEYGDTSTERRKGRCYGIKVYYNEKAQTTLVIQEHEMRRGTKNERRIGILKLMGQKEKILDTKKALEELMGEKIA